MSKHRMCSLNRNISDFKSKGKMITRSRLISILCILKGINGAKLNVVGMTCQDGTQVELKGFRWDCHI